MPTLTLLRGLPACGKTTDAEAWVAKDPANRARVNQDSLRDMAHAGVYLGAPTERQIGAVRDAAVAALLNLDVDVVSDDTNLKDKDVAALRRVAQLAGARFQVKDMTDVPLDVCRARNALRTGRDRVPDERICEMHAEHIAERGYPLPLPGPGSPFDRL